MEDREHADQRASNIDERLYDVRPYDGGKAAFEGVNQSKNGDDGDGRDFASSEGDGHNNGNGVHANSFRGCARDQKQACGKRTQTLAKAAFDQFIRGKQIAAKIVGKKYKANNDAANRISQ